MRVEERAVGDLAPYGGNPRRNDGAVKAVAESIRRFGFRVPIVIDANGVIVTGHTRLKAAQKLGLATVPCVIADDLTDDQAKAFRLADNKVGEIAEWDESLLALELSGLREMDFDISGIGFRASELEQLLSLDAAVPPAEFSDGDVVFEGDAEAQATENAESTADEAAAESPQVSKPGQLWILGEHRLMCGDATNARDVATLLEGAKVDMVFTDPPYGVAIGSKNKMLNEGLCQKGSRITTDIEGDTLDCESLRGLLSAAFKNVKAAAADSCSVYVAFPLSGDLGIMILEVMRDAGLAVRHSLVWVKNHPSFSMGRLDYDYQHEPILFAWNKTHKRIGGGKQKTSCWFYNSPRANSLHPTMKPIAMVENAILNSSEPGDVVLDLFCGSGSSVIASEDTGRKCRAMEIEPHYVDIIIRRWQEHTGREAMCGGVAFKEMESEGREPVSTG